MVKTGLRVYKNNIWHFFTVLGFVALGVIIGFAILIPAMKGVVDDTADKFSHLSVNFKPDDFFNNLFQQFKNMNWSNPMKTLGEIFNQTKLVEILTEAVEAAGLTDAELIKFNGTITSCANNIVNTSINEVVILISCVAICSIVGFVLIRTVIHFKTTENRNLFKYIITTIINVLFLGLIFYLMAITLKNVNNGWMYVAMIGISLLMVIGILTLSFWCYGKKGTRFLDVVNVKTIIGSVISDLVIVLISFTIVAIINIFNQLAAIMIGIPLFIITTIIMDCTTNAFVNNFGKKV